jgi:hypothetical protein
MPPNRALFAILVTVVLEFAAYAMVWNAALPTDSSLFWTPLMLTIGAVVSAAVAVGQCSRKIRALAPRS